jgi:hypothetical protein
MRKAHGQESTVRGLPLQFRTGVSAMRKTEVLKSVDCGYLLAWLLAVTVRARQPIAPATDDLWSLKSLKSRDTLRAAPDPLEQVTLISTTWPWGS